MAKFPLISDEATPSSNKNSVRRGVPKRAIRSFDNLVALANDAERIGRDARKLVWRDRGELPVELSAMKACLRHALGGGLSEP